MLQQNGGVNISTLNNPVTTILVHEQAGGEFAEIVVDVADMSGHDAPEQDAPIARRRLGGQPVRPEGHPARRGHGARVADLDDVLPF